MPKSRRSTTTPPEGYASSSASSHGRKKTSPQNVPVSSATNKSRSAGGYARAKTGKRPSSSPHATTDGDSAGCKKRKFSGGAWGKDEADRLRKAIQSHTSPYDWHAISEYVQTKSPAQCKSKNQKMMLKNVRTSMSEMVESWGGRSIADEGASTARRAQTVKSNAKASASVPHKARIISIKKAKPAARYSSKSAGNPKKVRSGGQRRASKIKKDAATQERKTTKKKRSETSNSIGLAPTSTTTADTQPKKRQDQSPTSIGNVSTTSRTKEGKALKRKPLPSGGISSSIGITHGDAAAPSSFIASAAASPKGTSYAKTTKKVINHIKIKSDVKKNLGEPTASGKWTDEESRLFDEAIQQYGRGDWGAISNHVRSRTPTQCKSHNQKMAIKEEKERAQNKSSKREAKKKKTKAPPAQVSTSTTPSRTVSPSPSPTTAHADAAAVLFSMRG